MPDKGRVDCKTVARLKNNFKIFMSLQIERQEQEKRRKKQIGLERIKLAGKRWFRLHKWSTSKIGTKDSSLLAAATAAATARRGSRGGKRVYW